MFVFVSMATGVSYSLLMEMQTQNDKCAYSAFMFTSPQRQCSTLILNQVDGNANDTCESNFIQKLLCDCLYGKTYNTPTVVSTCNEFCGFLCLPSNHSGSFSLSSAATFMLIEEASFPRRWRLSRLSSFSTSCSICFVSDFIWFTSSSSSSAFSSRACSSNQKVKNISTEYEAPPMSTKLSTTPRSVILGPAHSQQCIKLFKG